MRIECIETDDNERLNKLSFVTEATINAFVDNQE